MESNEQNSHNADVILVPESMLHFAPSSSIALDCMAEQGEDSALCKIRWDDESTKLLITEFKKNYNFFKNGQISTKKMLWQKIAEALNNKGLNWTPEQVENKYKTLKRNYRRSHGILSGARKVKHFKYENELSDIFIHDMALIDENPLAEEESTECVIEQESAVEEEEEEEESYQIFEETSLDEPAVSSNIYYTNKPTPRVKYRLPKKRPAKTSVDVLIEIKELMKKVELRRQIRHEQNLKVAVERNEILKKKNQLMEQMLKNS